MLNRDKLTGKLKAFAHDLRAIGNTPGTRAVSLCLPAGWPEQSGRLRWSWEDAQGAHHAGEADGLEALPTEVRDRAVVVWTPGADTLFTTATLPTRSRAKIMQALPFALEEQLLGEPDSLDFSYRVLGDGQLAVAVTARSRIEAWTQTLQAAGLRPAALCPITLALPISDGAWSAAFTDNGLVVRTGAFAGFECLITDPAPPAMLVTALQEARSAERAPIGLTLFDAPQNVDVKQWAEILGLSITGSSSPLAAQMPPSPPLSLLKSAAGGGSELPPAVRRLRPAAIMFGVWVIAVFGFNTFEWWQLSRTAKAQREEMNTLFKHAFPDAKVVVDPALQMQRNLADLEARGGGGSPGDLLPLLGQIAPVLQTGRAVELQGIQYAEQSATLDLRVPDFQAIEALSNALSARGLQVSIVSSNSRGTAVESRLRVSAVRKS